MGSMRIRTRVAAAGLFGTLLCSLAAPGGAQVIEQVLLKVNGEIFTKSDLEDRQINTLRQLGRQHDPAKDPAGIELRRMLDEITPQLLVDVVDEFVTVQRGRELGYQLADEQFQSIVENIKKDNNFKTDDDLQAALKQERMTLADLRKRVERTMIASRVQQTEVLGGITVSEDEARRYYDAHLSEFTTPQTVTLRELLVAIPTDSAGGQAGEEAARSKAEGIRQRVAAGEDFEKLVSELSDAPSRANGGLLGPLDVDELVADLRKRVEGMKVGQVSEVVRTARGFQILKLEASTPSHTTPFLEAKEEITNRVFTERRRVESAKYLEKPRAEAIIEWKNKELEKAFEIGLQQAEAGAPVAR
jgi:peptidyl-prolyl cis-trans isomerase SurA